jgi:Zn-dependent protease
MNGFRIGKVFGIDIRIAWSWVFIFVLLTWNLSAVFSGWHPAWPILESTGIALTASLLFFGCILLHELAHSVVAMGFGVRVRSITLFLFGGVSNIEREPPSPKAEFLTAIVGPITSILLGFGFLLAASLTTAVSLKDTGAALSGFAQLGPLETLLVWLGPINIIIGVFNMIPAFPLDGGRVLRSILWGLGGDLRLSTRRVSSIGQTFGWLFIVAAVMQPLESVTTATPEEPLVKAFEQLARRDVDQLPVLEGALLVGVLQRRDGARWLELAWGPAGGTQLRSRPGNRPASTATSPASAAPPFSVGGEPHPRST